mgnify:CR=1 FL=1
MDSTIYTFHVIGPVRNSFAHMLSSGLLRGKGELRGTLAQGRDLARDLDASITLLDGRGYRVGHRTATTRGSASPTAR